MTRRPKTDAIGAPRCAAVLTLLVVLQPFTCASGCTYPDEGAPLPSTASTLQLVEARPAAGSVGVPVNAAIDLYFDAPIASETVSEKDVRLFSGVLEAPGRVSVDLLQRRVRFAPIDELRPALKYRVRISNRLRGLSGSWLAEPIVFELTTGVQRAPEPAPPPSISAEELQSLWDSRCIACHGAAEPRAGVDLSSPGALRRTLVGIRGSTVRLLRVAPGSHADSYIMRKLLGQSAGLPMPPEPAERLGQRELRRVADWIDGGAR